MEQNKKSPKMPRFNITWIYILVLVTLGAIYFMGGESTAGSVSKDASYSQFKIMVEKGFASKIITNNDESKQIGRAHV